MTSATPLVTVGIPTYQRVHSVQRAIRSALGQTHGRLEVLVSDDASADATEPVLRALAEREPRLRYLRQPVNLGHARNFQAVLDAAAGECFMWLSDDDELDPEYVRRCLSALQEPGCALAGGLARYHRMGEPVVDERPMDLGWTRPGARVMAYLAQVNMNGALFGVGRTADLRDVGFADVVGGDWRLVAGMAARGRVRTLRDVHVHRSIDGLSSDAESLGRSFGLRGRAARHHHVLVAARFARELAGDSPAFAPVPRPQRLLLAPLAAALIVLRFPGHLAVRALLHRVGLGHLEDRAIAWVRSRDRR